MGIAIRLLRTAAWAPVAVVVVHAISGKLFGHEPVVDPVMHFAGGAAIAYFLRRAALLLDAHLGKPSELGLDIGAFGLACAAAVLWEFGEWLSDGLLGTNIQSTGGAPLRDIALGLAGAIAYILLRRTIAMGTRRRTSS